MCRGRGREWGVGTRCQHFRPPECVGAVERVPRCGRGAREPRCVRVRASAATQPRRCGIRGGARGRAVSHHDSHARGCEPEPIRHRHLAPARPAELCASRRSLEALPPPNLRHALPVDRPRLEAPDQRLACPAGARVQHHGGRGAICRGSAALRAEQLWRACCGRYIFVRRRTFSSPLASARSAVAIPAKSLKAEAGSQTTAPVLSTTAKTCWLPASSRRTYATPADIPRL